MNKSLEYYLNLKYPLVLREEEEAGEIVYSMEIPDLPGCGAEGKTPEEARKNLEEAKKLWIEESLKRGLPIPEPAEEYSGRILLRIPPALHGQLSRNARNNNVSLNKYITSVLESGKDLSAINEQFESLKKEIRTGFERIESFLREETLDRKRVLAMDSWASFRDVLTVSANTSSREYPLMGHRFAKIFPGSQLKEVISSLHDFIPFGDKESEKETTENIEG
jgi:predicted RNase H-like HicB family nuclease